MRTPEVTKRWLEPYIHDLAVRMRLADWTIEVKDDNPSDDDVSANSTFTEGRRLVHLRFCDEFETLTPEAQRHDCVHELLHAHHQMASRVVEQGIRFMGSPSTNDVLWHSFHDQVEYMVDALADAIAPLMPLPTVVAPCH